jgi:hypothetical protein
LEKFIASIMDFLTRDGNVIVFCAEREVRKAVRTAFDGLYYTHPWMPKYSKKFSRDAIVVDAGSATGSVAQHLGEPGERGVQVICGEPVELEKAAHEITAATIKEWRDSTSIDGFQYSDGRFLRTSKDLLVVKVFGNHLIFERVEILPPDAGQDVCDI